MTIPRGGTELATRRLVLVGAFVAVAGVTAALFAGAATGHLAAMHVEGADVTVVDYQAHDDDTADLILEVHNPTVRDVTVTGARMNLYIDGEQITDGTTAKADDVVVQSGETKRVTLPVGLREGGADRLRNVDPGRIAVRGRLKVSVVDERIDVPIDGLEVTE